MLKSRLGYLKFQGSGISLYYAHIKYPSYLQTLIFRLNAASSGFYPSDEGEIDLLVGSSHTGGIMFRHEALKMKKLSYLCYPGFGVSNPKQLALIVEDLKKVIKTYKVNKLFIKFGSNDAAKHSHVILPKNTTTQELNHRIVHGVINTNYDIDDPLGIINMYPNYIINRYDRMCSSFFHGVDRLVELLLPTDVTLVMCMGRFLRNVDEQIAYNRPAYYLRNRIYTRYGSEVNGRKVSLIDLFHDKWKNGTANLLPFHSEKEVDAVILQKLFYPKYGAVHYHYFVCSDIFNAILHTLN